MTIEEMKKKKREKGYTYAQISKLSGVPLGTVQKIFGGETENPRYETILALEQVFREDCMVRETSAVYQVRRQPGTYTIEDYLALPDDQRVELIDGYFYDMAAPTTLHQRIAGEIHRQIANYILDQEGGCTVFVAPVDVQLDNDEHTMVQPDVLIVCNPDQIIRSNILGAPDFVLEVISPGTKRKDYTLKLQKYEHAGVREYWLVDPYQKMVLVYYFADDHCCPTIYPIDVDIPVHIYEGKLVLQFKRIAQWTERYCAD